MSMVGGVILFRMTERHSSLALAYPKGTIKSRIVKRLTVPELERFAKCNQVHGVQTRATRLAKQASLENVS